MFINLSNHPFTTWSSSQLSAAREYGELQEIAFPNIDPKLSKAIVQKEADACVTMILETYPTENYAVRLLKKAGIRCVASTTERIVEETEDHQKLVRFSFVQFREY